MRKSLLLLTFIPAIAMAADALPDWAFLARTPGIQLPPEDNQPRHRPGSTKTYTQQQIDDIFNPPDWYPDPSGRHQLRYWDGFAWTEHVSTNGIAAVDLIGP